LLFFFGCSTGELNLSRGQEADSQSGGQAADSSTGGRDAEQPSTGGQDVDWVDDGEDPPGSSAVGSLREDYKPEDIVIPTQFFDRTRGRVSTFFGGGLVAHVGFAHPFCGRLSDVAYEAAGRTPATVHRGGTYVCMEGPQFSTVAESNYYRSAGFDIIGMTNLQEAKLAREAEICYTTLALVTDYDCWHPGHDAVTVEMVIATLSKNATVAQQIIANAVERLPIDRTCECARALATAMITRLDTVPASTLERLRPIIGKYLARA
jgi:5'-methylthioadenosine phosphorylase